MKPRQDGRYATTLGARRSRQRRSSAPAARLKYEGIQKLDGLEQLWGRRGGKRSPVEEGIAECKAPEEGGQVVTQILKEAEEIPEIVRSKVR